MKIPTVKIEFNELSDYIISKEEWDNIGGYHKWLKLNSISIRWIKKIHYILIDVKNYPTITWEG